MSNNDRDLQVLLEAKQRKETRPDMTEQIISEIKSSLLFQYSWEELVQAAPTTLSSTGACFMAASSDKAMQRLEEPQGEFRYLRYKSLNADLIESGNLGRMAFLEAERSMGSINMTNKVISNKIMDIIEVLGDPSSARKLLRPQYDMLRQSTNDCFERAKELDLKFTNWLLYVCELYAACVKLAGGDRDALLSNQLSFVAEQSRIDYDKSSIDEAKKIKELLAKQIDNASNSFRKAADGFPSGWDTIGYQIVEDSYASTTAALVASISDLMTKLSPMSTPSTGTNIVGDFVRAKDGDTASLQGMSMAAATSAAIPPQVSDPAYVEAIKISSYLSLMQAFVSGRSSNGEIDWDMASGSIKLVLAVLTDSKDRFSSIATNAEPSSTMTSILDTALTVALGVNDAIVNSSKPSKDSEQVRKWQADFFSAYSKAVALRATARSIPGGSANILPLMTPEGPPREKPVQAQAVLESAKNRLFTTRQVLESSKDSYGKTTDFVGQRQSKLAEIQSNLTRLTSGKLELMQIKSILVESIKLIINMKQQITNLVRFYKAASATVGMIAESLVTPFMDTLKALAMNGEDPNRSMKVGNLTLTDLQRSQIYAATITLGSHLSVFGDIAARWSRLSMDSILPGFRLVDEISMISDSRDSDSMRRRMDTLNRWATDASETIKRVAEQKQREIREEMESRINEVSDVTNKVTAPAAEINAAITTGINVNKEAAQSSIDQRQKANVLFRFVITDN